MTTLKHQSKWIELECQKCKLKDRLPLSQYQEYEYYTCPYSAPEGGKCCGKMLILSIRTLEFFPDIQTRIFI